MFERRKKMVTVTPARTGGFQEFMAFDAGEVDG